MRTRPAERHVALTLVLLLGASATFAADTGVQLDPAAMRTFAEDVAKDLAQVRKGTLTKLPPVQVISKDEYRDAYITKSLDFMWGGDYERSLDIFRALGMLPADLKAKPFIERYAGVMSAAAYDFLGKRIIFPQTKPTRDVLLHELCHAMQDERHDIAKLMRATGGSYDRILAVGALIEGEATNVQIRYAVGGSRFAAAFIPYETLRREARDRAEAIRQSWMRYLRDVPPSIIRTQSFVYDEGVLFVERLRRKELRWAAVDKAYAMPPQSTTQILHPDKYLDGEWPVEITLKDKQNFAPEFGLVTETTLGEFGMRLFLMTHLPDLAEPEKVVEGWRGDRALLYRNRKKPDEVALVWVSTWESEAKAKEAGRHLEEAMRLCAKSGNSGKELERKGRDCGARVVGCDVICGYVDGENAELVLLVTVEKKVIERRPPLGEKEGKP